MNTHRSLGSILLLLAFLFASGLSATAQTQQSVAILLGKARSLEARGRIDLASQNWQQVLLSNPNQPEALAGLARSAKQNADLESERSYLDRLRKVNPRDPAIHAIERMHFPTQEERDRLDEAGRLTMQHKPDDAMKIYHQVFGDEPPPGKWAGPFYAAEAASSAGHEKALAQLRQLCAHQPDNEMSRLWLALALTYDPKMRMEGFHLMQSIQDPGAAEQTRGPWRQALVWEKDNPAILKSLDAYLARYPDPELQPIQASLREKEERAAADASKERGFQALRNKDMSTAQEKFDEVLRRSPNDLNAIIGLGFVRLNQKRFSEALTLLERARTMAPQRSDLREGCDTARFWLAMQRGVTASQQNQPDLAITAYRDALLIRPQDDQASLALGQTMVRTKRYSEAESEFNTVLTRSPNNADAMAGLGFIRLNQGRFDDAQKFLSAALKSSPGRKDLDEGYHNAQYWGVMKHGADALAQNHAAEAIADYRQALALHPGTAEALLGLAVASERNDNDAEAEKAYGQLAASDPRDIRGWLGLMRTQIHGKNPSAALVSAQGIPQPTKQEIEQRSDYLAELALAYYAAKRPDDGARALQRALAAAGASDSEEALNLRLQVAKLLADDNRVDQATEIYRQAAEHHPNSDIAWQGLVGVYTRTQNYKAAMATLQAMPQSSYVAAAKNTSFLNSVAAVYSSAGQCAKAEEFLKRSIDADQAAGRQPAENTQLQLAGIWMRERNYENARQAYRSIIERDRASLEAWRNYVTVLHEQRADPTIVTEIRGVPPGTYAQLANDPSFLVLLASAHSTLGQKDELIDLLKRAYSRYQEKGYIPLGVEVQLAWAMVDSPAHDDELSNLLKTARSRQDLTPRQSKTIDEIWSVWSVRRAQAAIAAKQPDRGIAILVSARSALPHDGRIQSALATAFSQEHEYHKALDIYSAWGLVGAEAGDYRAAAGAALATHNEILADAYLKDGLQQWPADVDLLQMAAKQEAAEGKYDDAKRDLKAALAATRNQQLKDSQNTLGAKPIPQTSVKLDDQQEPKSPSARSSSDAPAACLPVSSAAHPGIFHPLLVDASYVFVGDPEPPQAQSSTAPSDDRQSTSQTSGTQPTTDSQKAHQIQDEIDVVQNRNTSVLDMGDSATGRTGDQGLDRLIIEDSVIGDSFAAANKVRFAVEAHGLYLFSGTPTGTSNLQFGTLPKGAVFDQQNAAGYGGELQLSTNTFGMSFGTSPQGFPTHNLVGGFRFRPIGGPLTLMFERDSVKDSLVSYAGVRDPGTGTVWGGVVSNTGSLQLARNTRTNGQYVNAGYSFIQGTNIPDNWNVNANVGAYQQIVSGLTLGINAAEMHYNRNLSFFSLGQGGYFSPQKYYLASIPMSWFSRHHRFEYELRAALGIQYLSNDSSLIFPTRPDLQNGSFYAGSTDTGPNYNASVRIGYRVAPHWYFEAFGTANNAKNFATQTIGFRLKYMMHRLPANTDLHVNSIPDWKGRQPLSIE